MAVVTTNSGAIANRDSSPAVLSNASISKGSVLQAVGFVAAVSGDSIASVYKFCSIPSNARLSEVGLSCTAISTTGAVNVGIYQTTANGAAAVNATFFAAAQVLTSALTNLNITVANAGSGGNALTNAEQPLWQALGLSADPGIMYDINAALTAAAGGAGSVVIKVTYVI